MTNSDESATPATNPFDLVYADLTETLVEICSRFPKRDLHATLILRDVTSKDAGPSIGHMVLSGDPDLHAVLQLIQAVINRVAQRRAQAPAEGESPDRDPLPF